MIDRTRPIGTGYLRKDGRKGIRDKVLVVYTVNCASAVARRIAEPFRGGAFDVDVVGCEGCRKNDLTAELLSNFVQHPNVGAVLCVGNGCEALRAGDLAGQALASGRPAYSLDIQTCGGTEKSVRQGRRYLKELLGEKSAASLRADLYLSELTIGFECGGSDFTSGLAANPLVGAFSDYMVDAGATVMFEEMYEAIGLKKFLVGRAANASAAKELADTYDKYFRYAEHSGQFSISPGNIKGGLTTIEEKSMGAVIKSGTRPIAGVVKLCRRPAAPGLWMMDAMEDSTDDCGFPVSNDASSMLLYASCGAHMTILTSGLGHVVNTPIIPTFKITGNCDSYRRLRNDMDMDVSGLLNGSADLGRQTLDFVAEISRVAGGKRTKGELLGRGDGVINYAVQFSQRSAGQGR